MVSVVICESISLGSSPAWGHHVVFLGKTLYSDSPPLHQGRKIGTEELYTGGNLRWASIASHPWGNRNTSGHFMLQKLG